MEYHDCYNHDLVQREQRNLGLNTFTLSCLMLIVGTYFLLVSIFGNFSTATTRGSVLHSHNENKEAVLPIYIRNYLFPYQWYSWI